MSEPTGWIQYLKESGHYEHYNGMCECYQCKSVRAGFDKWKENKQGNPNPPSKEELERWKALCDKATAGPWLNLPGDTMNAYPVVAIRTGHGKDLIVWDVSDDSPTEFPGRDEDAAFVAAARDALPRLIAEVERLRCDNEIIKHGARLNETCLIADKKQAMDELTRLQSLLRQSQEENGRLVDSLRKHYPTEGAWELDCPLCHVHTKVGALLHRTGCPFLIANEQKDSK